jgi:GNAT superfamily N-acetyltransferase
MNIKKINRFSNRVYDAVIRLLPQLAPGADLPSKEHFKKILKSDMTHFFIAEVDNNEIGMFTLASYHAPTGIKVWMEDVVIDEAHRGKGFGKEMMHFAIEYAKSTGAKTLDLTSKPTRIAANQLYKKTGFVLRETNVYRYQLK